MKSAWRITAVCALSGLWTFGNVDSAMQRSVACAPRAVRQRAVARTHSVRTLRVRVCATADSGRMAPVCNGQVESIAAPRAANVNCVNGTCSIRQR
jgi:hypothetical protein